MGGRKVGTDRSGDTRIDEIEKTKTGQDGGEKRKHMSVTGNRVKKY